MARSPISYEEVAQACERLQGDGQRPSVRRLQVELGGGSNSTLLAHFQRWQEARRTQEAAEAHDDLLSAPLRTALVEEIRKRQADARAELERQLADTEEIANAAQENLAAAEKRIDELMATLEQERQEADARQRTLEQELAAARARAEDAEQKAAEAQERADVERRNAEIARVEAAEGRMKAEAAATSVQVLGDENKELRAALEHVRTDVNGAEKRAAVAEERATGLTAQVTDLKAELGVVKDRSEATVQELRDAQRRAETAEKDAAVANKHLQLLTERGNDAGVKPNEAT